MIRKAFENLEPTDIEQLVTDSVGESQTLEYKRSLPGPTDADKKEFLADISCFSNAVGGDVVYGVAAREGYASSIFGLPDINLDAELLRLDSLMATGIEPRVRYSTKSLKVNGALVLVFRVERSWNPPHRVILKGHDKFYSRTSAGKFPIDVQQLRHSFLESMGAVEQVRNLRADRLMAIARNDTPIPMKDGSKLVLHLIPINSDLALRMRLS